MKPVPFSCMRVFPCAVLTALLLTPCAQATEGDSLWSNTYGGSGYEWGFSLIPSGDGGFLLVGWTFSFGAGPGDIWLVKVDAQGDSLWSHTYGGPDDDFAGSIIPSNDGNFLLAGDTESFSSGGYDMWLVKVNSQGDLLGAHTYGGGEDDWASSIIPSDDGGFLLAGGTFSFGTAGDMYLVKVDADGNFIWSHTYGGDSLDMANCIIPSGDGGFLLAGNTGSFGSGGDDMWLVKVNAQGDSLWSQTYGGSNGEWAYAVIPSGDGGFLLAGNTWSFGVGSDDMWLVKVNAAGDSLWSQTYGGNYSEYASSITPSGNGCFLLAGEVYPGYPGDSDMWLVEVNEEGDSLWSRIYGGDDDDWANSIIPSGDGNFLLVGETNSFGSGLGDMWLVCVEGDTTNPVAPQSAIQPHQFTLNPPHPNPFNPSTIISYELRAASQVILKVYDFSGRLVTTLAEGWKQAGEHRVIFDGSGLPSGLYLAKLTAGESGDCRTQTQKLVLLK